MNDETQARMDSAMAALADYFRKPESERRPGELARLQAERDAAYRVEPDDAGDPPRARAERLRSRSAGSEEELIGRGLLARRPLHPARARADASASAGR